MQKSITVKGKRFTAKMIDRLMQSSGNVTLECFYVNLGDGPRLAMYRNPDINTGSLGTVCKRDEATYLTITRPHELYSSPIYIPFSPGETK